MSKAKTGDIKRERYLIDASKYRLGRLATRAARVLIGKDKRDYVFHLDQGDYLVIINAAQIKISGRKRDEKIYYHSTGYIGNLKQVRMADLLRDNPALVIKKAIKGMIPANRLKKGRLKRLDIFKDENQPYPKKELKEIKNG